MKIVFWATFILLAATGSSWAQDEAPIYLHGGHLVDVIRGEIYEDIGVLIEGEKITGLFFDFPYNQRRIPGNAIRVDVSGQYLIPGMFDLHVHSLTRYQGIDVDLKHFFKMFLAGGVTTVRTMGNMDAVIRVKNEIDFGRADGPNLIIGGESFEQAPGFPKIQRGRMINNAIEARQLVRDNAYRGAQWIKFYNYGDADIVGAVVDETHRLGRKVTGHFAYLGAAEASRLGVDSLEHMVAILQYALDYKDSIAMTDIGYYRLFVMWPRANQEKLDAIFKVLVRNGTAVIPTLAIQAVVTDPAEVAKRSAGWLDLYQQDVYQAALKRLSRAPEGYDFSAVADEWRESVNVQARQVARFVNMGGIVGTGSDLMPIPPLVPGLSIHQEMQYFVEGGMTPLQALRAATIDSAKILGWQDRLGSIEVGKQADIVAIGGNPLADITAVSEIHTVIKAGRAYPIDDLRNQLRNASKAN